MTDGRFPSREEFEALRERIETHARYQHQKWDALSDMLTTVFERSLRPHERRIDELTSRLASVEAKMEAGSVVTWPMLRMFIGAVLMSSTLAIAAALWIMRVRVP